MTSTHMSSCLLALALVGCASSPDTAASSNDIATLKARPAHYTCTTAEAGQWPLELLTQASGAVDAVYGGGSVVLRGTLVGQSARLGQFLSGAYAVKLDVALLRGNAGTATLSDDESDGTKTDYAYACTPAAPVPAKFTCTARESGQYPLSLTTSAKGEVVADYAGGAISWTGALAGGDAELGEFLSGQYSVHLDADMLDGRPGSALLTDAESDANQPDVIAYDCTR